VVDPVVKDACILLAEAKTDEYRNSPDTVVSSEQQCEENFRTKVNITLPPLVKILH